MIFIFELSSKDTVQAALSDKRELIDEDVMPLPEEKPEPEPIVPEPIMSDVLDIVDENADINTKINFTSGPDENFKISPIDYVPKTNVEPEKEGSDEIPFALVEHKPEFQGGDPQVTFQKWVLGQIKYPESAVENGIGGKVIVQFTVDRDGYVKNVSVLKKVDPDIDREAVRVIASSPKWTPGVQRTKTVPVVFQFPVSFEIK
jgi:protein TonB